MPKSRGFTLIELLVVIAIMAIMGAYALSNYRSFGEDRKLKNAVLDVVSLLRQAQTNATTNAKCNTGYGATWQVEFAADKITINLKCSTAASPQKVLQLEKISPNTLFTVSGPVSCAISYPFKVNFTPLTGKINLGCTALTVTLTKGTDSRFLIIEKGGRIYAQ